MAQPWHVTLMGGLRAERGPHTITRFKYQKVGGLLAYLAYHSRQMHARELLVETFWPDSDPQDGRANLSVALSSLRNQFEPPGVPAGTVLRADRYSVGVHPTALTTDAAEFQETLQAAARHPVRSSKRAEQLVRAVELYQGPLLPGFYEAWIRPEQERLSGLFFDAVSALLALREEEGDLAEALRLARHAVAVDPLREEAHQQLIRLLAAMGQPGAALRQYKELERRLEEELGAEPSAPLRALTRRIERDSGLAVPPLSTLPAPTFTPRRDLDRALARLPETVTFLLTDIEGSTQLWERTGDAFRAALELHHRALRALFVQHGGQELKEAGGSFLVGFGSASKALACAAAAQLALARQEWPEPIGVLKVRMALHTGEVERSEAVEYHGLVLHRAAQMLAAAHGGQILVGEATAGLLRAHLPADMRLVDLGVFRLRDVPTPERLYQAEYPEMPTEPFAPPAAEPGLTGHLPLLFTRFFGRESEITNLLALLTPPGFSDTRHPTPDTRLITLTGMGGTGKTRLAVAVAERLVEAYRGAVWFVPLADLSDPARIDDAILDTLRLPRSPQREPREQVMEFLARQPSLLILDNFEHLLTAKTEGEKAEGASGSHSQAKIQNPSEGAQIVQDYLARVPSLVCLVTSRQVLGLTGEREFAVAPLPTPNGPHSPERLSLFDSVRLFIDRAQQAMPHFQVTNHNAAAVAELCDRLEGIPLSIELAAARALVLTPSQMLSQLERRFDLLAGRKRDVAERQRTLRAAIDWSYRLLTPELQRFFARLSVFRGGWSLEAAEAVCEAPLALDYLAELRECSLVLSEENEQGMRFRMLETLREYAREGVVEAGEEEALGRRHADCFFKLADSAASQLHGPDQAVGLQRLETEHDNLRAALAWYRTAAGGAESGLLLAVALFKFWEVRGHLSEGRRHLAAALLQEEAQARTRARSKALNSAGGLALCQGDYAEARFYFDQALEIIRELGLHQGIATVLNNLGSVALYQGDYAAARAYYDQALEIGRGIGDKPGIAFLLNNLGCTACCQGDYAAARAYHEQSLEIHLEIGNRRSIASSLHNLGDVAFDQGDYTSAKQLFEEALVLNRELGSRAFEANNLYCLGDVAQCQGDYASACAYHEQSLEIRRGIGDRRGVASSLEGFARLASSQVLASMVSAGTAAPSSQTAHDLRWAARLWGAADALRKQIGAPIPPSGREGHERQIQQAREALGEEAFAAAWEVGRAITWEQAVEYARSYDPE